MQIARLCLTAWVADAASHHDPASATAGGVVGYQKEGTEPARNWRRGQRRRWCRFKRH
jgi:mevalonate kinase